MDRLAETLDITKTEYDVLDFASRQFIKFGKTEIKCPRCGKPLTYEIKGSVEIVRCTDPTCIKSIRRGI